MATCIKCMHFMRTYWGGPVNAHASVPGDTNTCGVQGCHSKTWHEHCGFEHVHGSCTGVGCIADREMVK